MSPQAMLLAKIAACGLNPHGIAVRYDPELQSEVISLGPRSGVDEQQFECLWKVSRGGFVEIADKRIASQYGAFAEEKARVWMVGEATAWLKAQKFERAPVYGRGSDLRAWAETVETFCGFHAGEALEVFSPTKLKMRPFVASEITDRRRECLFNVIALSDLKQAGVQFGFVGNEYVPEKKP